MRGFALPTVIITSVVMMIVLLAGLTATTSITSNIREQHVKSLANDTAQAGAVVARSCIEGGNVTWSKLRTGDTCAGSASHCTTSSCYVLNDTTVGERTWFEVESPTPVGASFEVQVTAYYERLRTSNGAVAATSSDTVKAIITPSHLLVTEFAGGQHSVCSISDTNYAYCLGSNESYVLGNGENTTYFTPTFQPVGGSLASATVTTVSTHALHSCAISGGAAHCWGTDHQGALGNGAGSIDQAVAGPVDASGVLAGKTISKIMTAGTPDNIVDIFAHTCALDSTGAAYCWGSNGNGASGGGQLGDGTMTARQLPVAVGGGFLYNTIDGGKWHTCAIRTNDKLYCWGADNNGQIGNAGGSHATTPSAVQGPALNAEFSGAAFTKLASGHAHNCAINSNNDGMWCWGQNTQGQIGDGTTTTRQSAVKVTLPGSETGWADVVAGEYYTCGLALSRNVYCWGGTGVVGLLQGQIGDGNASGANRTSPTAVDTAGVLNGKTLTKIWNTWSSSIVQDGDGNGYSWGVNNHAQLGNGVRNDPTHVYSPIEAPLFSSSSVSTESDGILY